MELICIIYESRVLGRYTTSKRNQKRFQPRNHKTIVGQQSWCWCHRQKGEYFNNPFLNNNSLNITKTILLLRRWTLSVWFHAITVKHWHQTFIRWKDENIQFRSLVAFLFIFNIFHYIEEPIIRQCIIIKL